MSTSTLALIITYNPDLNIIRENVDVLRSQVEKIVIYDNSESSSEINYKFYEDLDVLFFTNGVNDGLFVAIEFSVNLALSLGLKYLLTMDQDSTVPADIISKLEDVLEKDKSCAIASPMHTNRGFIYDSSLRRKVNLLGNGAKIVESNTTMTSGTLMRVSAYLKLKENIPNLFIDYLDHYICLLLKFYGSKIIIDTSVVMEHSLGKFSRSEKLGLITLNPTHHSPLRRYYMARNRLYVYKRFMVFAPKWCIKDMLKYIKEILGIILLEKHKLSLLKSIIVGSFDFLLGCEGKKRA